MSPEYTIEETLTVSSKCRVSVSEVRFRSNVRNNGAVSSLLYVDTIRLSVSVILFTSFEFISVIVCSVMDRRVEFSS